MIRIGLIGRGRFGMVYAKTLTEMGVEFRQMGMDWNAKGIDGMIIASKAESHYMLAKSIINARIPCLIEKPIAMSYKFSTRLLDWADAYVKSIVFVSHTRLYSPAWQKFKYGLPEVTSIEAEAGGRCKIKPQLEWGPHLVSMCLDLEFDPGKVKFRFSEKEIPFKFVVNGQFVFEDVKTVPSPLTVMIGKFIQAIELGDKNIADLELAVKVMAYLE